MRPPGWLVVVLVGALAGLVFAGVSTYDFVQHLDRQVHSLHCSFIPGAGAEAGHTGCQAAMMSPYSSVFRTSIWGGIPISLSAMAVFAFLLFYSADLLLSGRKDEPRATAFLVLATALPSLASVTMLFISITKLGTTCKLCVGIYIASALCLTGAIMMWRRAVAMRATQPDVATSSNGFLGTMFGVGVLFVVVPLVLYVAMVPDHGKFIGTCGQLDKPDDTYGVMVPVQRGGATPALEILDPLCPACRAFEDRLAASGLAGRLDRRAILFPLDTTCNWMITENTHPGACTVSEAVLCAGDRAPEVIRWAFEVQDRVREETAKDPAAAARIVKQRFPELAACVGSPEARSRLNKSLRWSVANNIRVLTPQLFVNDVKLCDEDVDIGLDYALSRMVSGDMPSRVRTAKPVEATPATPPPATPKTMTPAAPAHEASPTPPGEVPTAADDRPVTSPSETPAAQPPAAEPPLPEEEKRAPAPEPAVAPEPTPAASAPSPAPEPAGSATGGEP